MANMGLFDDIEEVINQIDSPESGYQSPARPSERINEFYQSYSSEIPHLEILEQPQKLYRFRYITEFKDNPHGPLTGETSSKSNKTFPSVKLNNFNRKAIIRCWLFVNNHKDVHVHQLLTKNDRRGIRCEPHDIHVNVTNNFTAQFEGLNIIHAVIKGKDYLECFHKKKAHVKSGFYLNLNNVPFDQRALQAEVKSMEKNKAVLFFEAFDYETKEKIHEIFSHEIKNSKNPKTSTLKISRQSHKYGSANGGTEVFIFVEKVTKDIKVVFYEMGIDGDVIWEDKAVIDEFWHQVAIAFRTPAYVNINLEKEKKVYFKLIRESDSSCSNEMEFFYQPEFRNQADYSDVLPVIGKKRRVEEIYNSYSPSSSNSAVDYSNDSAQYSFEDTVKDINILNIPRQIDIQDPTCLFPVFGDDQFYNGIMMPGATLVVENNFEEQIDLPSMFDSDSAGISLPDHDMIFKDCSSTDDSSTRKLDDYSLISNLMKYISEKCVPSLFYGTLKEIKRRSVLAKKSLNNLRNVYNKTPLHMTIEKGRLEYVKPLIKAGFDINALDSDNNSALHLAVKYETREFVIDHLLDGNANGNLRNYDGDNALHIACRKNKLSFVKSLLNETDINSQCEKGGNTPLHIVSKYGYKEIAELLLKAGAKWNIQNDANKTAFECAIEFENEDIINLFLSEMDLEDRKNIYLIEENLNNVESEKIYNLLESFLKNNVGYTDFQIKNNEEINLSNYLNQSCTV